MPVSPRANRGPGAASENRAALIAAAREIFATTGLHAPLSAVAKRAGVGQGSLYRHFPTRFDLAMAVFQDDFGALDALVADEATTLDDVLRLLTDQAIVSTAFFEMIEIERADVRSHELADRIQAAIAAPLAAAKAVGDAPDWVTPSDVLLTLAMLTGALSKTATDERPAVAGRVWALLPFGPR